jgi:hypothetical protein
MNLRGIPLCRVGTVAQHCFRPRSSRGLGEPPGVSEWKRAVFSIAVGQSTRVGRNQIRSVHTFCLNHRSSLSYLHVSTKRTYAGGRTDVVLAGLACGREAQAAVEPRTLVRGARVHTASTRDGRRAVASCFSFVFLHVRCDALARSGLPSCPF